MLQTKSITKDIKNDQATFNQIKQLYKSAFPKQEQAPIPWLLSMTKKDTVKFDAYYDDDVFVGITYTLSFDGVTYLWYFATSSELRGKGYGSQILHHLNECFPNDRIVLNLEVQDASKSDSEMRKKRKEFYIRNGYTLADYSCIFNRNHLDVMFTHGAVTKSEFLSIFKHNFNPIMHFLTKPKIVD